MARIAQHWQTQGVGEKIFEALKVANSKLRPRA
jgi:hypothetical protein